MSTAADSTNVLTYLRRSVMEKLETDLQPDDAGNGTFEVNAGDRDGAADRKLCHVFVPTDESDNTNVNYSRPTVIVRAWLPKGAKQPAPRGKRQAGKNTSVADPEQLEQLMVDLLACLEQMQVLPDIEGGPKGVYFFATRRRFDYTDWGVEVTLRGWTENTATLP